MRQPDKRTSTAGPQGEIGYVVMGFPRLSETFISNEVLQLESLGARLRVFAVKRGGGDRVHESVSRIRAPIVYLPPMSSLSGTRLRGWLRENFPRVRGAHARLLRRRPAAYLATLVSAIAMCWRYRVSPFAPPRKVFIKEFLQAGEIAQRVIESGAVTRLHGHFCHGAATITWFASRLAGVPFSFTAHAKDIYQLDQNPGDLLARKIAAASFVATCTDANRAYLSARHPHAPAVHTVYHGLDTDYFAPQAAFAPGASSPVILAVGRFVEKKGFRYLIEACASLRDAGFVFRCLLVGEDGDELPAIRALIARLDLVAIVALQGPVIHTELRRLYSSAAVFALPCLVAGDGDRDGIPNVLAEAMSMELAVVTTGVSGIPELVESGVNGVIVPERDVQSLAAAIAPLIADPERRRTLGRAARATICQVFDSRHTTVALKRLFDSAMGGGDVRCVHPPSPARALTEETCA